METVCIGIKGDYDEEQNHLRYLSIEEPCSQSLFRRGTAIMRYGRDARARIESCLSGKDVDDIDVMTFISCWE